MIKWKVQIEGLPVFFMEGSSASAIRMQLRKILRSPDMLQDVSRVTEIDFKKMLRNRLAGKDVGKDEEEEDIDEDAPATAMGGGGIAGGGIDLPGQPGSGEPGVRRRKRKEVYDPDEETGKKQVLMEPDDERKLDGRRKAYKLKEKQLLLARSKRKERLQASYSEQTESTRPERSRFISDILYK
tara:strand:+ start:1823 stop:2374 length:552 start_codon:yes stop_codon:yes gene_type:complete